MVLLVLGILVGFVIAAFSGGKIADIRRQKLRIWWTLPLAAVLFVLPVVVNDLSGAGTMHALGYAALMAFAAANLQLTGIPVVMVGIALNLVPLAFNGTVPVSEAGALTAEIATIDTIANTDLGAARTLEDGTMRFIFLGDTIPVSLLTQIYSFGDLIMAFGLANVMYRIVKPRKERFDDEQAGWPESTVPTEDVSSDPWTAMLRGEIDDADFAAKTGPQPSVVAAAAVQNEWVQDPPVDTGPMMIMGAADSEVPAAPEDADAPDALDLSLTWADEPPAEPPPAQQAPRTEVPPPVEPPAPQAPGGPAPEADEGDRSPFAPPPAAVIAAAGAAAVAASSGHDDPQEPPATPVPPAAPEPPAAETTPKVFDQENSPTGVIATPSTPTPPYAPPQTAPQTAPATPSAPLAPPSTPTPPAPRVEPAPAPTPAAAEPTPQPPEAESAEPAPPEPAASPEAEPQVEGRSFAPQLPDLDDDSGNQSAFAAALAAFDDERRNYGGDDDSQAAGDTPEHDTGPMPVVDPSSKDAD